MLENEKDVCGIGFLHLGPKHPFNSSCKRHDLYYVMHEKGTLAESVTKLSVDRAFLFAMLNIIQARYQVASGIKLFWYLFQAILFYFLARTIGKLVW